MLYNKEEKKRVELVRNWQPLSLISNANVPLRGSPEAGVSFVSPFCPLTDDKPLQTETNVFSF